MKDFVLDSFAVISYLNDEAGSEKVAEIFERCVAEEKLALFCVINWGEVYYHALRTGGEKKADFALQLIRSLPINIIEANKELTLQAAKCRMQMLLQLP